MSESHREDSSNVEASTTGAEERIVGERLSGLAPAEAAALEAAGRRIAPMLGSYSGAVVLASNPFAATYVALGIGRSEATRRKVAIGDLVGDIEPLQSLLQNDDNHGISDSFAYGVSLNKIAQPVDAAGNLFIMPSGTTSVANPAIYKNARWHKLANGFREVGALLLLVAPKDTPGIHHLINQMDGIVLVDLQILDSAPYANILARVPAPPAPKPPKPPAAPRKPLPFWLIAALMLALLALAAATVYWGMQSAGRRHTTPSPTAPRPVPLIPAETLMVLPPVNPEDSANAAEYAVELATWNSSAQALARLTTNRAALPGGTISPVPVGESRETFYKVIAGAFTTPRDAERMLRQLRDRGITGDTPATVVRTPYALLLDSAEAGRTQQLVQRYAEVPFPAYVLVQTDGSLKLYTGAFERPEDSATLMLALRALYPTPAAPIGTDSLTGDTLRDTSHQTPQASPTDTPRPVLVYRTGRLP